MHIVTSRSRELGILPAFLRPPQDIVDSTLTLITSPLSGTFTSAMLSPDPSLLNLKHCILIQRAAP